MWKIYLNTTIVKVKPNPFIKAVKALVDLNTTIVKVKPLKNQHSIL